MRWILVVTALIALTLAAFALWPGADLSVAHAFYDGGGFIGASPLAKAARQFFSDAPFYVLAAFIILYLLARWGERAERWLERSFASPAAPAIGWLRAHARWAPSGLGVIFLIATLAIGPGLVVNLGLKDHAHRPRPVHVVEFGGSDAFRPWYRFDGACKKNCSFVSGEAASGFWMVAPALLAPPPWRAPAVVGALVFGAAASALRLAFGGHFLSDVLLAGLIALLVILITRRVLWPKGGP